MASDLGLDPNDPLNLLLHNSSQDRNDSVMNDGSRDPQDWSQVSSMWGAGMDTTHDAKFINPALMDFNLSNLPMDLDYNQPIAVDPSALQYDPNAAKLNYEYDAYFSQATEFLPPGQPFPFTFQPNGSYLSTGDPGQYHQRRLSVTSSSSSSASGASLSPVLHHSAPTAPGHQVMHAPSGTQQYSASSEAADELAQRVRQSAGMVHAVRVDTLPQDTSRTLLSLLASQNQHNDEATSPISTFASTPPSMSSSSSAASTPPPSTPPTSSAPLPPAMAPGVPMPIGGTTGVLSRPKTSHTTIERRYRTNLNARIQSLRMAVPALRVLENQSELGGPASGARKVKVKIPIGTVRVKREGSEDGEETVDVVDDRGFVDGVKVARKCSKANVLGKAVEYIRVLKKRELRLKREQAGLKSLVSGLVGGPALLKEWEREWFEKFGGEEKDEIEGDDIDDGSDEDDEDDEEGEAGRKRKKQKVAPKKDPVKKTAPAPPQPPQIINGVVVPEKRKRGRPRKVVPPTPSAPAMSAPAEAAAPYPGQPAPQQVHHQQPGAQQYLLATFALFSFFNSPLTAPPTSSSAPHTHTGTVLSSHPDVVLQPGWGWRELIQAFHLIVSCLVFASIVLPWLPLPRLKGLFLSKPKGAEVNESQPDRCAALEAALHHTQRGKANEGSVLRKALGPNVFGIFRSSISFQQKGLEQRAWIRLAELAILKGPDTSYWSRLQLFLQIRTRLSGFSSSAADLSSLALVILPLGGLARSRAEAIWEEAKRGLSGVHVRTHEQIVLDSMTVEDAAQRLKSIHEADTIFSPITLLARTLVTERLKKSFATIFIRSVLLDDSPVQDGNEEAERKKTVDAAKSLGGKLADLGEILEKVWTTGTSNIAESFPHLSLGEDAEVTESEDEVTSLLRALLLYRRIFPSSVLGFAKSGQGRVSILLSPPPSPGGKDLKMQYALRRALDSHVFESQEDELGAALEDARDRVVDVLVDNERRGRRDEC